MNTLGFESITLGESADLLTKSRVDVDEYIPYTSIDVPCTVCMYYVFSSIRDLPMGKRSEGESEWLWVAVFILVYF